MGEGADDKFCSAVMFKGAGGRGFLWGVTRESELGELTEVARLWGNGEEGSGGGAGRGLDWPNEALLLDFVTVVGDPTEEAR